MLVIVGVHSPKFEHEADPDALAAAVERYGVAPPGPRRPRAHDLAGRTPPGPGRRWSWSTPRATSSRSCPARATPTPSTGWSTSWSPSTRPRAPCTAATARTSRHRRRRPSCASRARPSGCRAAPCWSATRGHHSLVELADDAETVLRRIGAGDRGSPTAPRRRRRFSEPQGLCLLPPDVAGTVGYDVVVADTVNHALRGVRLDTGDVTTVAGTGAQWMQGDPQPVDGDPRIPLSSPWDVAWSRRRGVVVAMAGIHQLWRFDPVPPSISVWAGTTNEGLVDGPARRGLVRAAVRARRRRPAAVAGRLRDVVAAGGRGRCRAAPRSGTGSSTSGTSTARPSRRCCSTRWA